MEFTIRCLQFILLQVLTLNQLGLISCQDASKYKYLVPSVLMLRVKSYNNIFFKLKTKSKKVLSSNIMKLREIMKETWTACLTLTFTNFKENNTHFKRIDKSTQ